MKKCDELKVKMELLQQQTVEAKKRERAETLKKANELY